MNKIIISCELTSSTHKDFSLDCLPTLRITQDKRKHIFKSGEIEVGKDVVIEAYKFIDSFLASMSIICDGVFSRIIWDKYMISSTPLVKFISPQPTELAGTGLSVTETRKLDSSRIAMLIPVHRKILNEVTNNNHSFTILIIYSVSNWFFNSELLRESAINYFSVVEAIASIRRPQQRDQAVYRLNDIFEIMDLMGIDSSHKETVKQGFIARGELAHGHPKHQTIYQHSMNTQPVTSWQLKEPALKCKAAADLMLNSYFALGNK